MRQIQELEAQKETWDELPPDQRGRQMAEFSHIARLARYHNLMGMENIRLMYILTSDIQVRIQGYLRANINR